MYLFGGVGVGVLCGAVGWGCSFFLFVGVRFRCVSCFLVGGLVFLFVVVLRLGVGLGGSGCCVGGLGSLVLVWGGVVLRGGVFWRGGLFFFDWGWLCVGVVLFDFFDGRFLGGFRGCVIYWGGCFFFGVSWGGGGFLGVWVHIIGFLWGGIGVDRGCVFLVLLGFVGVLGGFWVIGVGGGWVVCGLVL